MDDDSLTLSELATLEAPRCTCCGGVGHGPDAWAYMDSEGRCPACSADAVLDDGAELAVVAL